MKKPKMVYLEWVDSASSRAGWISPDRLDYTKLMCATAGFVLREDKESITVVGSYGIDEYGNVHSDITIPKIAIKKRRVLKCN